MDSRGRTTDIDCWRVLN